MSTIHAALKPKLLATKNALPTSQGSPKHSTTVGGDFIPSSPATTLHRFLLCTACWGTQLKTTTATTPDLEESFLPWCI